MVGMKQEKHELNIARANRHLDELNKLATPALKFWYLRNRVSAYEFEEMILSALNQKGHTIKRNSSYSGDFGVDGAFIYKGEAMLIQAKRYSGYVSLKDVEDLQAKCERLKRKAIFVHTGLSGRTILKAEYKNVDVISGKKVIDLLSSEPLTLKFRYSIWSRLFRRKQAMLGNYAA